MNTKISTKYGTAILNSDGYYVISSNEKGNRGKQLHRLIARDYFGEWIDNGFHIHHLDGDVTNNCVLNLMPLSPSDHRTLHNFDNNHMKGKTGDKCPHYGKRHSLNHRARLSKLKNTTGIYRVTKMKRNDVKQGFVWVYQYYDENRKRRKIVSVSLKKLEKKVKSLDLDWFYLENSCRP